MNNLNSILLEGNLVKDPELSYSSKGTPVCNFSVASNRYYKQGDETNEEVSYFDVTTWSRLAEVCNEYLTKGRGVRIVGRLKQDRWDDQEGKTRSKVHIVAEHVEFKPKFKSKEDPDQEGDPESNQDSEEAQDKEVLDQAASF
ncbi:MAG: single-stranded DNA-binding protein [Planctomycetes bacterium]|nr:single-stranded DNA-binding protein [Planctomycetota bacterium]